MREINDKFYLSKDECLTGHLGFPIHRATWQRWTNPDNDFDFPEPLMIEGVDHWEADAVKAFIERQRG